MPTALVTHEHRAMSPSISQATLPGPSIPTAGQPVVIRAWRHELKYVVPAEFRSALHMDLHALAVPDRHGRDGCYEVRSLYFDSRDWACYYDKLAGLSTRRKLRLRAYPDQEGVIRHVGFEIKRKVDARTCKTTVRLPVAECRPLLDGLASTRSLLAGIGSGTPPALTEFLACRQRFSLRPVVLMTYAREALRWRSDAQVRVTLDERLAAAPARHLCEASPAFLPVNAAPLTVLEVKFPERMPRAMIMLLKKYRLRLQSISKYCMAVTAGPFGLNGLLDA